MKNYILIVLFALLILSCEEDDIQTSGKAKPDNTENRKIGYIQSISEENGNAFLKIDYFDWFSGEEGGKAMKEDDPKINLDDMGGVPPDDYYIRNEKNEFAKVPLSNNISIKIESIKPNTTDEFESKSISLSDFKSLISGENKSKYSKIPFWVELKEGKIVLIEEQFIP